MDDKPSLDSQNRVAKVITEPPSASTPKNDGRTLAANGTAARVIARTLDSWRNKGNHVTGPPSGPNLAALSAHLPRVPREAYAVGDQVARGGIGRVMRARDERLDRPVAIKELLVWNEEQEERFVREALLTARLQHPAIVPVYEAGRWEDGEPFYTMKLVSGRTLCDLIGEKKTLAERLAFLPHVITVAQAIAYAHSQRILHRDLKPANVLVGEFGETVVIDWGLAKGLTEAEGAGASEQKATGPVPASSGDGLTIEGAVVGTPAYMPPEQAAGRPVDERADVYAIGAMLYHLIAAVPPYHGVSWDKLLATIAAEAPRPVEKFAPQISDDLCAIIHKAMARDPDDRYPTAKALADDLERFQTGHIVAAHTYSTGQLLRRFWRRNRTALSVAVGALSLMTLVVIGAFIRTDEARRIAEEHEREAQDARAQAEATEHKATARADELTLLQARGALERDPNEALAWLKTLSPSFSDAVEMRNLMGDAHARGLSRVFRGHTAHVNSVNPLRDGKHFVSMSDDKTIRVWDIEKDAALFVLEGHTDEVWFSAVFPDKKRIVSTSKDATVRVWDVTTGRELAKVALPEAAQQIVVRADGAVVGSPNPFAGSPWVWVPGEKEARPLVDSADKVLGSGISGDGRRVVVRLEDDTVFGVDTESGKRLPSGAGAKGRGDNRWVLTRDGRAAMRSLVREQAETEVEIWDVDAGTSKQIKAAGLVPRLIAGKTADFVMFAGPEHIYRYDIATEQLAEKFAGPGTLVYSATLTEDGQRLITGGYDRTVRVWDLQAGGSRTYAGLEGTASWVAPWSNDGSVLAASSAGDVRLFEPSRAGAAITHHASPSQGLALSKDGNVASLSNNGALRVSTLQGELLVEHALGAHPLWFLQGSPDRQRFAATWWDPENLPKDKKPRAGMGGSIVLGTFDENKPVTIELPAQTQRIHWDPDGKSVIVALVDGTIHRVRLDGSLTAIDRSPELVTGMAISPSSQWLVVTGFDGLVRVTDLRTGDHRDLGRHAGHVFSATFSGDSKTLATGSDDHTFRLWRLDDGSFRSIDASGGGVRQLVFSPDQKSLFVLNLQESFLRRWSLSTFEELPRFMGHAGPVQGFAISKDQTRIVTRAYDSTARIFDIETGKSRALTGLNGELMAADFTADGKAIITLSKDGAVRRWPDELPATIPELRTWLETATPDKLKGH